MTRRSNSELHDRLKHSSWMARNERITIDHWAKRWLGLVLSAIAIVAIVVVIAELAVRAAAD